MFVHVLEYNRYVLHKALVIQMSGAERPNDWKKEAFSLISCMCIIVHISVSTQLHFHHPHVSI